MGQGDPLGSRHVDLLHCVHHPADSLLGLQPDVDVWLSPWLSLADSAMACRHFPVYSCLYCWHVSFNRPIWHNSSFSGVPYHCPHRVLYCSLSLGLCHLAVPASG